MRHDESGIRSTTAQTLSQRWLARSLAASLLALLAACGGGSDSDSPGSLARLEVTPASVVLSASGRSVPLTVRGFDANGVEIANVKATFVSSRPSEISVDASGAVSAPGQLGSALVVASVGDVVASPVSVIALKLAPGVTTLSDAQILTAPTLLDAGVGIMPMLRATVDGSVSLPRGSLMLGTGQTALAGRVVSTRTIGSLQEIDVEVTPIETLVSDMSLNLQFSPNQLLFVPTNPAPVGQSVQTNQSKAQRAVPLASSGNPLVRNFNLGRFECKAEIDPSIITGEFEASIAPPNIGFSLIRNVVAGRTVSGEAIAAGSFEAKGKAIFRMGAAVTSSVACSTTFGRLTVPVFGLASLIIAPSIPLRLDTEVALAVSAAAFTFGVEGTSTANLQLGLRWTEAGTEPVKTFDVANDFKRTVVLPTEAGIRAKATMFIGPGSGLDLSVGNVGILSLSRLELVKVQAGPEFEIKLGTLYDAANDPLYTTEYDLKLKLAATPGDSIAQAVRAFTGSERSLDMSAKLETSIARSPQSTEIKVDAANFSAGTTLNFSLRLDPRNLVFPITGYNVSEVRIYRLVNLVNTSAQLIATARPGRDGQLDFSATWTAPDAGDVVDSLTGKPNFYAFLVDNTFSPVSSLFPLELGPVAPTSRAIGTNLPLSAGDQGTCALKADSTIACWGLNIRGQNGTGNATTSGTPQLVRNLIDVISIARGEMHACALTKANEVYCWGANSEGQLGDGGLLTGFTSVPQRVPGAAGAKALVAGLHHTCALMPDATIRCWGHNGLGQLGNGSLTNAFTPTTVNSLSSVVALSANGFNTCAVSSGGGVSCWGTNDSGQIGTGIRSPNFPYVVPTPTAVRGVAGATAVSVGGGHSCALRSGKVSCWGDNSLGQLGRGTVTPFEANADVVGGLDNVDMLSSGGGGTCAKRTNGELFCWGWNRIGQLGDQSIMDKSIPTAVQALTEAVSVVSMGDAHTCVLTVSGNAYCWGDNFYGALGSGGIGGYRTVRTSVLGGAVWWKP